MEFESVLVQNIDEIFDIISSISSALTLDDLLAEFAERSARLLEVDGCTIFRFQPDNDTIVMLADFVSAEVDTPFGDTSHIGATYPLAHYPATKTVLREQSPLIVYTDDPEADEAQKTLLDAFHWDGVLMTPIVWRGQSLGLLNLYVDDKTRHQFSDNDIAVCRILVNQAAMVMENAQLRQEAEDGRLISEAMQVIGLALGSELDYQRIVSNVAEFAYRLVNAQFVYVAVPEDEVFQLVAVTGYSNQDLVTANLLSQAPFVGAIEEKRPIIVADIQDKPATTIWQKEAENQGWRAMVSTPLLSHNRLVGVLVAFADEPHAFSADDVATLMSLASQAAAAIHNAQLFAQLEAQRETLHQVSLRLVNAQEEERRRISRELHDELGQALTALKINLDVARRSLTAEMKTY
jgi:GAF domain-containing protein